MNEVELNLNENGNGEFFSMSGDEKLGVMQFDVTGDSLKVYHTEVSKKPEAKGLAKRLLDAMVDYARKNELKVIPLCPYVHLQFKRHPDEYKDIWKNVA